VRPGGEGVRRAGGGGGRREEDEEEEEHDEDEEDDEEDEEDEEDQGDEEEDTVVNSPRKFLRMAPSSRSLSSPSSTSVFPALFNNGDGEKYPLILLVKPFCECETNPVFVSDFVPHVPR
jgi:hypothetical protein